MPDISRIFARLRKAVSLLLRKLLGSSGKVALISQGCSGIFKGKTPSAAWGNEMMKKGKVFSSGIWGLPERYPVLSDGSQVHSAEVAVQAVEYWYETLRDPLGRSKKF